MLAKSDRLNTLIATGHVHTGRQSYLARVELISPERAQDLLDHMTKNRPVNKSAVRDYSRQLTENKWRVNGEPIIISDEGETLDGQHRCIASVETGTPFMSFVIYGIDRETFSTMGRGRTRRGNDIVGIEGCEIEGLSPARAAALVFGAIRNSTIIENQWSVMSYTADNEVVRAAYDADPANLIAAVVKSQSISHLAPSQAAGLYYVFAKLNKAWADVWADQMATGAGLKKGDPVLFYRERLTEANGKNKTKKISAIDRLAIGVKVWNALVTGVSVAQYKGVITVEGKRFFPKAVKPILPAPTLTA
jgi:hypothetical protein